jgi:hypothetical protein
LKEERNTKKIRKHAHRHSKSDKVLSGEPAGGISTKQSKAKLLSQEVSPPTKSKLVSPKVARKKETKFANRSDRGDDQPAFRERSIIYNVNNSDDGFDILHWNQPACPGAERVSDLVTSSIEDADERTIVTRDSNDEISMLPRIVEATRVVDAEQEKPTLVQATPAPSHGPFARTKTWVSSCVVYFLIVVIVVVSVSIALISSDKVPQLPQNPTPEPTMTPSTTSTLMDCQSLCQNIPGIPVNANELEFTGVIF